MATYRVVCVRRAQSGTNPSHHHLTHLGLQDISGRRSEITVQAAVNQVRSQFGDRYYTISASTGARADVIGGECEACGQRPYVRTTADGIRDNNLSALSNC